MEFKENNKPIYLQLADKICDAVMAGRYVPGERIPSVRETAAQVEVNANTVMRTYDSLQADGVIYNKRGIGFFVADNALEVIRRQRTEQFLGDELEQVFARLVLMDVSPAELSRMYTEYFNNNKQQFK